MKKVIKIILIIVVAGLIGLAVYLYAKKKQDAKDRESLNGMTRGEFFDRIRPDWETKFRQGMTDYLDSMPLTIYNPDTDTSWSSGVASTNVPTVVSGMNVTSDNWKSKIYQSAIDNGTSYEVERNNTIDYLISKGVNPMKYDWAYTYWLPTAIDNMGINYNDELVQKLIYKI